MRKVKKKIAGVIVVSMLIGSNVVSLAAYNSQLNKISEYKHKYKSYIRETEEENQSLKDEIFIKNNQLHKQQSEIEEYKLDIDDQKVKVNSLKERLEKAKQVSEARPSKPTQSIQVSRGKVDNKISYQMQMTSYFALCESGCTGIAASGIDLTNRTTYKGYKIIATDKSIIPMYSIVRVDTKTSSFHAVALDTGGLIRGNVIDLLVGSKSKANKNGRQYVTVTVLREGKGS